jgi:hypothetical protein
MGTGVTSTDAPGCFGRETEASDPVRSQGFRVSYALPHDCVVTWTVVYPPPELIPLWRYPAGSRVVDLATGLAV